MSGKYEMQQPPLPPEAAQNQVNDIVNELRRRGLHDDRCPRCRTSNWATDFFQMPIAPIGVGGFTVGSLLNAFIPVVCFTCTNCGNTLYHNLRVLGKVK
jgi:hypothetical protein